MTLRPQAYIFVGRSGSGKGTQSSLLIETLQKMDPAHDIFTVETGKELRKFIEGDSLTQKLAKKVQMSGGFQPSFIAIYNWVRVIVERYQEGMHMVYDGTSRRLPEAIVLETVFDFYSIEDVWVIYLDIDDDEAVKRLLARGRADDTDGAIKNRLGNFERDMKPSIDFFKDNKRFKFIDIDGKRGIDEVHADIVKKVGLV